MKTITDLMDLAIQNNNDDLHIFVNFSGHVNSINITLYYGGWSEENKSNTNLRINSKEFEIQKAYIEILRAVRMWKKQRLKTFFDFENQIEKIEK
jgi:hypothetical protein